VRRLRAESGDAHPLLATLPAVIHIQGIRGRPLPWVAATLRLLGAETGATAPGSEAVVSRLADALLTQALRVAVADLDATDGARVQALRDPHIANAVPHPRPAAAAVDRGRARRRGRAVALGVHRAVPPARR
jgi:hypothetical protein